VRCEMPEKSILQKLREMNNRFLVFLDTSALFAGIWSPGGGARMILRLGEAGAVQLLISPQVLEEIERVVRMKAPEILGLLTLLLDRSNVRVVSSAKIELLSHCQVLTNHPGDAVVLAEAWAGGVDYLVTLDRQHLLDNQPLREAAPFIIGTPGDCLAWLRGIWNSEMGL